MSKPVAPAALLVAAGLCVTALAASSTVRPRPDCPGKVVCPLTGDLVCADRCPLRTDTTKNNDRPPVVPSCCRLRN